MIGLVDSGAPSDSLPTRQIRFVCLPYTRHHCIGCVDSRMPSDLLPTRQIRFVCLSYTHRRNEYIECARQNTSGRLTVVGWRSNDSLITIVFCFFFLLKTSSLNELSKHLAAKQHRSNIDGLIRRNLPISKA